MSHCRGECYVNLYYAYMTLGEKGVPAKEKPQCQNKNKQRHVWFVKNKYVLNKLRLHDLKLFNGSFSSSGQM